LNERSDLPADFFVSLGNEYLSNDLIRKGIDIYKIGLQSFPYNTSIKYNIGYSEYLLGNYDEAISYMIEVLKINPYYSRAHQILGNIMSRTEQRTKAVLSLMTYLSINSDQNWALIRLNDLLSDGYREEETVEVGIDNSNLEYYDRLLRSKAALDDRFRSKIDFEVPVAQQMELLLKKLKYKEDSSDFWMEFYVPFLESIANQDLADALVYFILYSSKNENIITYLEKNEKEKEQWIALVQEHFDQVKLVHKRTILDSTDIYSHWYYNSGVLSAIGNEKDERNVGPYEFYHPNGRLKTEGAYDLKGNKIGVWNFYHENGQLSSSQNHKNGKVEGVIDFYKEKGELRNSGEYTNDELDGYWTSYYACGAMSEKYPYSKGVGEGNGEVYYETGETKITYAIAEGKNEGPYILYYKSGKISNECNYVKDKLEGKYKSFFPDGSIAEIGQFSEDQRNGKWQMYSISGDIESTGLYKNGEKIGPWEYQHPNGSQMRIENYNDVGKLQGISTWFDVDGKIHSERFFENGMLVGYRFFDKQGDVIVDNSNEDGNMEYIGYFATGGLYSKGFLKKGLLEGPYATYHYNGQIAFVGMKNEDSWDGAFTEYDDAGNVKVKSSYKDESLNGYYRSFHKNGNIKQEGWLINGEIQQRWVEYYINGALASDGLYTDGTANELKYYDLDGRLSSVEYYDEQVLSRYEQYDTLGNMFNEQNIGLGESDFELKTPSGKLMTSKTKKCGEDVGETVYFLQGKVDSRYRYKNSELEDYTSYNAKGRILIEGNYLNDERHGDWNYYYDDGKLEYTATYIADKREGKSTSYYANGQVEIECGRYKNDRNGPCKYYDPQGELQLIKHYLPDYGSYGFQYMLSDGQLSDTLTIDRKSNFELKAYFANGNTSIVQQYKMGYLNGQNFYYNAEGQVLSKSSFLNGVSHGTDEEFYSNGQLKHEEHSYFGENHGIEKSFHKNGQLKEIVPWSYGSKEGWSKTYDDNGQLLTEIFYRNDAEY
jgi:antitoxin component YwqK of YwqJK toxin-antitoxin module